MLSRLGFEAEEAENGRVALEVLEHSWPLELALVDWNMPEMNGLEFIQEVRSRKEYDTLPMMMVTTEGESARVRQALEAGANEYLMKPFDQEALHQKLVLLGMDLG